MRYSTTCAHEQTVKAALGRLHRDTSRVVCQGTAVIGCSDQHDGSSSGLGEGAQLALLDLVPTGVRTHVLPAFRWPVPLQTHTTAASTGHTSCS